MTSVAGKRIRLDVDDPTARRLVQVINSGELTGLRAMLADRPGLAAARLMDGKGGSRTPLHVATDWPGHFPNGVAVVATLAEFGADPNALSEGRHDEGPLHWAASSDDVDVLDALIDAGAELDAGGGSVSGGTPLDNAVGYGCWQAARRLVERGATVKKLWHAAALGLMSTVERLCAATPAPTSADLSEAFWHACHGGQPRSARYLLDRGAHPHWTPSYDRRTALEIATALDTRRRPLVEWLSDQRQANQGAQP